MSDYDKEVKRRFGETAEYKEFAQKTADYSAEKRQELTDGLNAIFIKFANCKQSGETACSPEAQLLVKELQNYITANYYTCTNQILACLGQMYIADNMFKNNIDKFSKGTAEFISEAIKIFCLNSEGTA